MLGIVDILGVDKLGIDDKAPNTWLIVGAAPMLHLGLQKQFQPKHF